MPGLLTLPGHDLPPDLKCQVVSFMRIYAWSVFQSQPSGWDYMDQARHPFSLALVEGDVLISHAEVNWRLLDHAGQTYRPYGLSAVFTYPQFRGQGYGHHVVLAGTNYIQSSDADVAMLVCKPELIAFYEASAWSPMNEMQVLYGSKENPERGGNVMMLFVSEKGKQGRAASVKQLSTTTG